MLGAELVPLDVATLHKKDAIVDRFSRQDDAVHDRSRRVDKRVEWAPNIGVLVDPLRELRGPELTRPETELPHVVGQRVDARALTVEEPDDALLSLDLGKRTLEREQVRHVDR